MLVAYHIPIPSKIPGSDSVLKQCLEIVTAVKGSHTIVFHEKLGDVMEENQRVRARVSPGRPVRSGNEQEGQKRDGDPVSVSFNT